MRNLPNILTASRIVMSILVVLILLNGKDFGLDSPNVIAFWFFLIASLTDFLDGYLARKYNFVSIFGEIFDPLADKILILGAFIGLLCIKQANPWAVFIILSREFFVTGLRVVIASNQQSVRAGVLGKWKTVLQIVAICFLLLDWKWGDEILWVATFITLYSGMEYALHYYKSLR